MSEYIVRMPSDMPYELKAELNAWYVNSEPIVRCRDCRWLRQDMSDHEYRSGWWCDLGRFDPMPNGFCAWGERRVMEKA